MGPGQSKTGHLNCIDVWKQSGGRVHYGRQRISVFSIFSILYIIAMGHGCDIDVTGQRAAEIHVPYDEDGGGTLSTWEWRDLLAQQLFYTQI